MIEHPVTHKKVPELAILKSFAFLAVVLQSSFLFLMKTTTPSIEQSIMIGMFFNFVKFSAPLFIFLAGFTIVQQYYKHLVYRDYLFHKTKEIIFPYLIWSLIYILCLQPVTFSANPVSNTLFTLLTGTAAPHLWYVVMVYQFHLLVPIIFWCIPPVRSWLENKRTLSLFIGTIAVLYTGLMWVSQRYFATSSSVFLQMTDRTFLAYSFYFIIGGIAALTLTKWRQFIIHMIPLCTILYLCLFGRIGYELLSFNGIWDIKLQVSTYLKPTMFFYILIELILLYGLAMLVAQNKSLLRSTLNFISRHTYSAYLSHLFFLYTIGNLFKPTGTVIDGFILFFVTVVISIAFAVGIQYLRLDTFFHPSKLQVRNTWRRVIYPTKYAYQFIKKTR